MINPHRGEVALILNDEELPMRLSLGALASLEAQLKEPSLLAMVERFETGKFETRDLSKLLCAGLQGAGWQGSEDELLGGHIKGGPVEAAKLAGRLLRLTFGSMNE